MWPVDQIWYSGFSNVVTVVLVCSVICDSQHWKCWIMMVNLDLIVEVCAQCEPDFDNEEQLFLQIKIVPWGF